MSETETEAQGQKPKTSKLAIASILIPTITTSVIPCLWIGILAKLEGFRLTLIQISSFAVLGTVCKETAANGSSNETSDHILGDLRTQR